MCVTESRVQLFCGDCLTVLPTLADAGVDTVITDPPSGTHFMGKSWDSDKGGRVQWIDWLASVLVECYRIAKPGATLLCWALPRTSHWTGTAIEQAGWEPVDVITHLFGSGFPKAANIGKLLDKRAGVEREVVGRTVGYCEGRKQSWGFSPDKGWNQNANGKETGTYVTAPATPEAQTWDGWYSHGLKPAAEFWWVARKPNEGSYAENALRHAVSGLWMDGCRVEMNGETTGGSGNRTSWRRMENRNDIPIPRPNSTPSAGRFPANLVLSHADGCDDSGCVEGCAVAELDRQSGTSQSKRTMRGNLVDNRNGHYANADGKRIDDSDYLRGHSDTGGSSRFFYVAKASRSEREAGLEGCEQRARYSGGLEGASIPLKGSPMPTGANHHPTVKPLTLMRYLVRLTRTPSGGVVLDPFAGSGTTGMACCLEGRGFIGIEREAEYFEIARRRIEHARQQLRLPEVTA